MVRPGRLSRMISLRRSVLCSETAKRLHNLAVNGISGTRDPVLAVAFEMRRKLELKDGMTKRQDTLIAIGIV